MSSNQGVQKDVSAATPESGTQTISQDRLALARTKTKAEINKVLLPAKATKRTSRLTSKTPKQQQFGNKKLKMSEYLYNDHLQALAATLTAQAHLYNKAFLDFRLLDVNCINILLEARRLREANAPMPVWMPPGAVETADRLIAMEESTLELMTAGLPRFVCCEISRRVLDKDLVGSKSMVALSDDEAEG